MQQNIGKWDRVFRLTIAVILIVIAIVQKSLGTMLMGLFTLYEALAGWCVFYQLLGRNTCELKARKSLNKLPYVWITIFFLFIAYPFVLGWIKKID